MNPKTEHEGRPVRIDSEPVSQMRPVVGEDLTRFVPPASVRAYALEHDEEPPAVDVEELTGIQVAIEIDVDVEEPSGVSHERTRIVPARAVEAYARKQAGTGPTLARATLPTPVGDCSADGGEGDALEQEMFDHIASRQYAVALMLADSILQENPEHKQAKSCRDKCNVLLERQYVKIMGSTKSIPMLRVSPEELRDKALDPRAGFILSLVDGATPVETLLDLSSMPRLEALRLMYELTVERVIEFA
jgi:hypothetical protein